MREHTSSTDHRQPLPPMRLCDHHSCRCARAAELAAQGRTLEAIAVHEALVRCRELEQWSSRP